MHSFVEHILEYSRSDSGIEVQETELDKDFSPQGTQSIKMIRPYINFSDLDMDPGIMRWAASPNLSRLGKASQQGAYLKSE